MRRFGPEEEWRGGIAALGTLEAERYARDPLLDMVQRQLLCVQRMQV